MWVQSALDALHDIDCVNTQLFQKRVLFTQADSMFACACAFHLQSTINHILDAFFYGCSFFGILAVVHDAFVEVSVPNVSEDASEQA